MQSLLGNLISNRQADPDSILGKAMVLRGQLSQNPDNLSADLYGEVMPEVVREYAGRLSDQKSLDWLTTLDIETGIENLRHEQNTAFTGRIMDLTMKNIQGDFNEIESETLRYKMSAVTRIESQRVFEQLVDRFDGDLMKVKDYVNGYAGEVKDRYITGKIGEAEYKKSLTFIASVRGKSTYRAFENYVKVEMAKKVIDQASGISGILGGRKKAAERMQNVLSTSGVGTVMSNWKQISEEFRKRQHITAEEVWTNAQTMERTAKIIDEYWRKRRETLDQDSLRLLTDVGVDSSRLSKLKRKAVDAIPVSLSKKLVLASLLLTSLSAGAWGAVKFLNAQKPQHEAYASAHAFLQVWDKNKSEKKIPREAASPLIINKPEKKVQTQAPKEKEKKKESSVTAKLEIHLEQVRIVDSQNPLDEATINQEILPNLVTVADAAPEILVLNKDTKLNKLCIRDLKELFTMIRKEDVSLYVRSGYRSIEQQKLAYDKASDKNTVVLPGTSQHHTGLAIDFTTPEIGNVVDINANFSGTKAGRWLAEHAWEYGFVLSYTNNHDGIRNEDWHYYYVGRDLAGIWHDNQVRGTNVDLFALQLEYGNYPQEIAMASP
ncbi:hypothetical protein A3D78_06990 [Candidatus Gottesmanbacteria bacterium RIFCSPHIGHO2_02_FULL_39_14]|uniref:D-alanyl-D-alanine carboxypeptidase-like core domain-containing protein n=1 Tax=Candidatus Gottesmanbacteria bacterium RIFCSPHIGHO2_02_FULL_39_14 TaxID=1798383 RepID=A0A1F5ZTV3_9BACT|nr:MAG: hypothetical protein A3D78_06990 [Candidatus Gottesmanbacteria bacterium RIFCSPHIGHO2_02_FULL_39_14]